MDQTNEDFSSGPGAEREHGTEGVGEEFRLLLDALAYRAEEFLHGLGGDDHGVGGSAEQAEQTASRREPCPCCAVMSLLRGERPELSAKVFDQLAGLVALLRRVLAEYQGGSFAADGRAPAGDAGVDGSERADDDRGREGSKVQRIDVRRVRGSLFRDGADGEPGVERCSGSVGC